MITLIGQFTPSKSSAGLGAYLHKHHFGRMWSKDYVQMCHDGELWGFDNGAWSAFVKKQPWPRDRFERRLEQALTMPTRNCVVAVTPDIVAGGMKSLDFSLWWREQLPDELPWFLAVQDGMTIEAVREVLPRFRGIFLGGSTPFKRTACKWCQLAHSHAKYFHWGRCVSLANVREARAIGANSIDSTAPLMNWVGPARSRAIAWLRIAMGRDLQRSFLNDETHLI